MDKHLSSRRGYLGATGVLLTGTSLAGCTGVSSAAGLANSDAFNVGATFELSGDGPGEPVTLSLGFSGNVFERTFQPGEEFEDEVDGPQGDTTVEVDYSEDEGVEAHLKWSREGLDLDVEIEQSQWNNTAGNIEISFENEELTTTFDATITLSEAATEITGTDTRTVQAETEYEIDIPLTVDDDGVEGGLEIGWDDGEDDDTDDDDSDEGDDGEDDDADDDDSDEGDDGEDDDTTDTGSDDADADDDDGDDN